MKFVIKNNIYKLVAFVVLGSGIVNVFSASGRLLSFRIELLLDIFPLEFLQLSNFLTMGSGIALAVIAVNLYRRKRKAFVYAIVFSCLSIVFHLVKGIDYEEAILSFVVLILLLITKKEYWVKSEVFNYKYTIINLLLSFALVLFYGILGFWFLDKNDFGVNFSLWHSVVQTWLQITFSNMAFVPKTHYAEFFVESLHWAMVLVLGIGFSSFFVPVIFKQLDDVFPENKAKKLVEKFGETSLDYFKVWSDKSYFLIKKVNAFISYDVNLGVAIVLGDPVGQISDIGKIVDFFYNYCVRNGWRCGFYQVLPKYLDIYHDLGFKSFKIGDEAIVDLTKFTIDGKKKKYFRQVVNKFEKNGYRTEKLVGLMIENAMNELKSVSDNWLVSKGRKENKFSLGYFDRDYLSKTLIFVVKDPNDRIVAFANKIEVRPNGIAVDLMRYSDHAPNGTMDYLFVKFFLFLKEQGYSRFSLGLVPMSGFHEGEKFSKIENLIHQFIQKTEFLYNFRGLRFYKAKYAHIWEPRYLIYRNVFDLPFIVKSLSELFKYSNYKK